MKKKWTYEQSSQAHSCHINEEKQTIHIHGAQYSNTIKMEAWLTTTIHRLPLAIEQEVTKSILPHLNVSTLSKEQLHHYRFWSHLNSTTLQTSNQYPTIKPYPHWKDSFLELTSLGAQYIEHTSSGTKRIEVEQRLDHLFFQGPSKALALNCRVEIRNLLLNALSPESGFTRSDIFPLFDYAKLPFRRYEHSENDNESGTYWILENSYITVGGWSRQGRDGGANLYSIETAWPNLRGLSGSFEQHREEIYAILENAIIKE